MQNSKSHSFKQCAEIPFLGLELWSIENLDDHELRDLGKYGNWLDGCCFLKNPPWWWFSCQIPSLVWVHKALDVNFLGNFQLQYYLETKRCVRWVFLLFWQLYSKLYPSRDAQCRWGEFTSSGRKAKIWRICSIIKLPQFSTAEHFSRLIRSFPQSSTIIFYQIHHCCCLLFQLVINIFKIQVWQDFRWNHDVIIVKETFNEDISFLCKSEM